MAYTHIVLSKDAESVLCEINHLYKKADGYGAKASAAFKANHPLDHADGRLTSILEFLVANGLVNSTDDIYPTELGCNRAEYKFFHILYTYLIPAAVSFFVSVITTLIVLWLKGSL